MISQFSKGEVVMKLIIEWNYQTRKKQEVILTTELMPAKEALLLAEDFEKTGRTKELHFYDERYTKWTKKELLRLLKEVETEPHDIVAYFDGGFNIENHIAGVGIVLYYTQNQKKYRIRKNLKITEIDSNNEAEYIAFWSALQLLEEIGVHHLPVVFKGDSHVVLNQLSGDWPCFEDSLNTWLNRIEKKMNQLGLIAIYEPISRKDNTEADKLATQALQGVDIYSKTEVISK